MKVIEFPTMYLVQDATDPTKYVAYDKKDKSEVNWTEKAKAALSTLTK